MFMKKTLAVLFMLGLFFTHSTLLHTAAAALPPQKPVSASPETGFLFLRNTTISYRVFTIIIQS